MAIATLFALPAHAQDVPVDPDVEEEQIIVTGQREALNRAIESERRSDNLVNVIEATDIGQFADQNVAESLQRVPGVTLNRSEGEGRSVSVRGLPSSFTTVTVNGVRLGTSNLDSSAVSLDSVSNDQLEQVEVSKSILPSQDADTIGGAIDLKTISAFTRRDQRIQGEAELYYNEDADAFGEEFSANITRRFFGDRLGVAASLSYSRRPTRGVELENDGGLREIGPEDGEEFLSPAEATLAIETGERTRWNGSLNLEFRPDDNNEMYLRGTYSRLQDDDLAYQDIWVIEESEDDKVLEVRPGGGGVFDDVELEKRLFFQDITDSIASLSMGGRHHFDSGWGFTYQADYSGSRFDNPEALRGRFAVEEILARIDVSKSAIDFAYETGDEGDGGDPTDPGDYEFNQLLFVQEFRRDDVMTGQFNLYRDFTGGRIQTGVKYRTRKKSNDRSEFTGKPEGLGFAGELEDLPIVNFPTSFGYSPFFPSREETLGMFRDARDFLIANNPAFQRVDLSNSGDYRVNEDVVSGYVQATYEPSPGLKLIGGVRVERTSAGSQGFFTEFDSSGRGPDGQPQTGEIINLGTIESVYTDWFPSAHLRWEVTPNLLFRASYAQGLQRPDFTDRANRLRVQFDSNDPTDRDLFAGNPFLNPLKAKSFDASLAWYPTQTTALSVAGFYKDITDFFFDFNGDGSDLVNTPIILPPGVDDDFENIQLVLNGEQAKVWGVELSFTQSFTMLPGILSGLFMQANATFARSEATANVRDGEVFGLPDQRELVGNLSVGWENDLLTMRLAANHQGRALVELAGDAEEDIYASPSTFLDFNLRVNVTDNLRLSFDAVNLTKEKELEFYQGDDNGSIVFSNSRFGRVFKAGVRVTF